MSTYRLRNDLDNLTYDLEHLVLGSWGQHLHLGRVCPLEGHCAECWAWERSSKAPPAESLSKKKRTRSLVSLGICVWGRSLSWGWRLWSGRPAGALESPNYLVLFLPWRTNARFCLLFLLCLKAVRCKGGRFFSLDQKRVLFLPLWWMILSPVNLESNPALLRPSEKKVGQKGIFYNFFLLYK